MSIRSRSLGHRALSARAVWSRSARLAALLASVGLLALGCSSPTTAGSGESRSVGDRTSGPAEDSPSAREEGDSSGSGDTDAEAGGAQDESADGGADGSGPATLARGQLQDRAIIREGRLTIEVEDVREAARTAAHLVDGTAGYLESEQGSADDDGTLRRAHLVLRVEVGAFDQVAQELRDLGAVTADRSDATDVTEELVDVESRIASQRESIKRVRTLLSEANDVGEILQIESELTSRQSELESLQSRQATLSSQSSLSTLAVTFRLAEEDTPSEDEEQDATGFWWGLGQGWGALLTAGSGVLTVAGMTLPFLILVAAIGLPAALVVRNRTRRRAAPTPTPEHP